MTKKLRRKVIKIIVILSFILTSVVLLGYTVIEGAFDEQFSFLSSSALTEESKIETAIESHIDFVQNDETVKPITYVDEQATKGTLNKTTVTVSGNTVTCESIIQGVRDVDLPDRNIYICCNRND